MTVDEEPLKPSKVLYGVGATQMFSDSISHRYINLLAVTIGITISQMGYLSAAQSLSRNIMQLLWGRMADRHGKRLFIALGRLVNGVFLIFIIFVNTPLWFILLVICSSIVWSVVMPSWRSLQGDYTTHSRRGEVIGKINAVSQVGGLSAMIFAFLTSFLQPSQATKSSYTSLFVVSAVMSIVSGILILFTVEKPPLPGESSSVVKVFQDKRLLRYLVFNLLFGFSLSFAWPLFPFVTIEKLGMTVWQVASLSICSTAFSSISQRYAGALMDRAGRRPIIFLGRLVMSTAPLVYVFSTSWIHLLLAEVFLGVGMGAWMSSEPTYIIDLAPQKLRATYLAFNTAAFGVSTFLGSLAGGQITESILGVNDTIKGINLGLLLSATMRFLTALLYLKIHETLQRVHSD